MKETNVEVNATANNNVEVNATANNVVSIEKYRKETEKKDIDIAGIFDGIFDDLFGDIVDERRKK